MFYENELKLLQSTFQKSRVPVNLLSLTDPDLPVEPDGFEEITRRMILSDLFDPKVLQQIEPNTVYKLKNGWSLCYLFLLLPATATDTLLVLGPYAHSPITDRQVLEICEKNGLPPKVEKMMIDYGSSLPVIPGNSHLFTLLDCFCEQLWGDAAFSVVDVNTEQLPESLFSGDEDDPDKTQLDIKTLEMRYQMENEMLEAVAAGQGQKIEPLFSHFPIQGFEMRTTDPLRNAKNYCVIMNTLLRKAAEKGGVHPLYLDRTSSKFAKLIEQVAEETRFPELMSDMFRSYCRLVRKHSTRGYSAPVRQAVLLIDEDLSADLRLTPIADKIGVSREYLSGLFKKEVGKSLTEYVREKRMNRATVLLRTTGLQVQTVALHCGIEDVQYFSKLFKQQFGLSPKEYREKAKKQ